MKKRKAQSNVITIVLIILLVLVAVVILWNVVYGTIGSSSKKINTNIFDNSFEIKETKVYLNGSVKVSVRRGSGNDSIDSLKFLFYNKKGETTSIERTNIPGTLETYNYEFKSSEINTQIDRISVVPIIGKNAGLEAKEPVDLIRRDSNGDRIYDIPDGLVSWWKFDNDFKDSVGSNDGKCSGNYCPIFDVDKNGNPNGAAVFDGDDTRIKISDNDGLDSDYEFSLSAWVNPTSYKDVQGLDIFVISKWYSSPYIGDYILRINPSSIVFLVSNNDSGYKHDFLASLSAIPLNKWANIIFTYDNGNITSYVNSNFNGSKMSTITHTTTLEYFPDDVSIGGLLNRDDNSNYNFNGSVDDVMIFNKALNEEEIKAIYNAQKVL